MCSARPTKPRTSSTRCVDLLERQVGFLVQLVADVLADGERVEERAFLEHHAEVLPHRHHLVFGQLIDALALDPDGAGVRLQQAENQLQDGRLAGAAGAQEDLGVARAGS